MKSGLISILTIGLCAVFLYFFDANMHKTGGTSEKNKQFVNVYTSRKEELLRDILAEFTETTGIAVNIIYDEAGKLISKMESEQVNPIADLLITADVMNLEHAKKLNLLEHIDDMQVFADVDNGLFDDEHKWVGLTKRARVFVYAKDRVDPNELVNYFDLADEKWRGKILITSSKSPYNQSLIAGMLVNHGENQTEDWMNNFVKNFARKPQGGETEQIIATANGIGDLTIVNSYYYGRLMKNNSDITEKTGVFFPNQNSTGAHINISGAALIKNAKNEQNAIALIKFMLTPKMQSLYANQNCELPVIKSATDIPDFLRQWSKQKMDHAALKNLFAQHKEAFDLTGKFDWQ